jgi:hypothetical protein
MLKECNTAELKILMQEHTDAIFYRICRTPIFIKGVKSGFVLAPNKELHSDFQSGKITWEKYVFGYGEQLDADPKALVKMEEIKRESESMDVYLVCVCGRDEGTHCHRFLLMDMIHEI